MVNTRTTIIALAAIAFFGTFAALFVWRASTSSMPSDAAPPVPSPATGAPQTLTIPTPPGAPSAGCLEGDDTARLECRVAQLTRTVEQLVTRQRSLEATIATLSAQVPASDLTPTGPGGAAETVAIATATATSARPEGPSTAADSAERRARLLETGMAPENADAILELADTLALERVQLRYDATREGWQNTREYREKARALANTRETIREAFGDDAYDSYLYATRRGNRVVVNSVLRNSAAEQSGIQSGDVLLSYDNERVYRVNDVLKFAAQGGVGDSVAVEVLRNGERVQLYAPRGPLGFRGGQTSMNPAQN